MSKHANFSTESFKVCFSSDMSVFVGMGVRFPSISQLEVVKNGSEPWPGAQNWPLRGVSIGLLLHESGDEGLFLH